MRSILIVVGLLLSASAALAAAPPEDVWPARPVRFLIPFPASTPPDILARIAAQKLSGEWRTPVVVEPRDGAGGTIAVAQVAKSPPDGYTLLFTPDLPIVIAPALDKTPYDPLTDLVPIGAVAQGVSILVVHPSTGLTSVADLVAAARARPGKLTYASSGEGSTSRMCLELIKHAAGIDVLHVPYKGAAPAIQAVVSGEVSMFCSPLFQALPLVRGGKLRAIGLTGAEPTPLLPEVAPIASQGLPDVVTVIWYAVFTPAGTPANVRERLREGLRATFDAQDVRERLAKAGLDPAWVEAEGVTNMIRADIAKWTRIARAIGIGKGAASSAPSR